MGKVKDKYSPSELARLRGDIEYLTEEDELKQAKADYEWKLKNWVYPVMPRKKNKLNELFMKVYESNLPKSED